MDKRKKDKGQRSKEKGWGMMRQLVAIADSLKAHRYPMGEFHY